MAAILNLSGIPVYAATPAGTEIENTAMVNYLVGEITLSVSSNTATLVVEEGVSVSVTKSAAVSDSSGGERAVSGSIISYTLAVKVSGNGTADGVVITDPIPANTTYAAGTLRLDGFLLTDAKDADAGDVGETTAGEVTVTLGDVAGPSETKTITFDVRID